MYPYLISVVYTYIKLDIREFIMSQIEEIIKLSMYKLHTLWHYNLFPIAGNQISVSNIVILIILLLLGIKYSKNLSNTINHYVSSKLEHNGSTASNLGKIIIYTVRILYIIIAMAIANIPLGSFAFIGGALAFGLGFGTQNLITNFISGIIIMIEQPIKIGDIIEIKGVVGKVVSIGIRCVVVRTATDHSVLIPSSEIILNNIVNWTLNNDIIKYTLEVIIPRTGDTLDANNMITQLKTIIQPLNFVAPTEDMNVFLSKVDANNFTFSIKFGINLNNTTDLEYIKNDLNVALYSHLKNYNCSLNHL